VPILATGIQDFRKSRQKPQKKPLADTLLPTFSIVVPVRNEEKVIGRLLAALSKLNYPVDKKEIVIVEDGSTDKTFDICTKYAKEYAGVKIIHRPFSNGKPSALNVGLENAKGEIMYEPPPRRINPRIGGKTKANLRIIWALIKSLTLYLI
jgi:cellulose synthase/poly-beta-1,6-N-acetylglucosamine synthase-like glycosyltransferase